MSTSDVFLRILIFFKLALIVLLIIFACIYASPVCFLSRFRSPIDVIILNVCMTFIGSAVFWIVACMIYFNRGLTFDIISQQRCSVLNSVETILNCYAIYSLCSVSIYRFCSIHYSNRLLFRTRRWVCFSILITWFTTICLTLPHIVLPHIPASNRSVKRITPCSMNEIYVFY